MDPHLTSTEVGARAEAPNDFDREDRTSLAGQARPSTRSNSMESVVDSECTAPSDCSKTSDSALSQYSTDWPQKQSVISTTVSTTTSSTNSQKKPEGKLRVKTLCLLGALMPGIGCYFCVLYTYLFQMETVRNFTSSECPEVHSSFPPISYSIGVWMPQKYIWLTVLALHMPPRFLYGLVYKGQYCYGQSEYKNKWWFGWLSRLHCRLLLAECTALIVLSAVDIETAFIAHAICYAIWITCLNFNMLFNVILHHYSGIRILSENHDMTFYFKCALWSISYPLSVSTGISYAIYFSFCSSLAYAAFSIAEYVIVGINCAFYFTLIYELKDSMLEIHVRHREDLFRAEVAV